MMRWLKNPGRSVRSECLKKADDGNGPTNHGEGEFRLADRVEPGSDEKAGGKPDDFACGDVPGELKKSEFLSDVACGVRWERFHGGRSLALSGLAGIVLVGTDLVDPNGSSPGRVFGGVFSYLAGVLVIFALDRRHHRNCRALLPPDRFGGGRFALIFAAIVLASVGREDGGSLAAWLAFAAFALGGWSDGGWIAIAAERRGEGLWSAWRQTMVADRDSRKHCWVALFGNEGRLTERAAGGTADPAEGRSG